MAIQDGSQVSVKTVSTDFTNIGDWTSQPPMNGIAYGGGEGGSGPYDVLWQNGLQSTAVPVAALDEITTAGDVPLAFLGKTVTIGASSSPNYESVVVGVYNRNGESVALLKSVATGVYREIPTDDLVVVKGH